MANPNKRSPFSKAVTFVDLNGIPGPRGYKYFLWARHFQRDAIGAFTSVNETYGDIASFPWPMNSVIIYSPEYVQKVLIEDGKKYIKGEQIEELRAVVGDGLATNNDYKSWLKSRSIISREFGPRAVKEFEAAFEEITADHLKTWKTNETFDICEDMKFLTFDIACKTLLKSELSREDSKVVNDAVYYTSHYASDRIYQFFPIPYFIPTPTHRKFDHHYDKMVDIVLRLIRDERKNTGKTVPKSVLEKLVHAVDEETGTGLSDEELRDEVLTLMLAGHETSAHSLTWIMGLLAKHPEVQDKIVADPNYLRLVLLEGMRLYPAFPILSRKANDDLVLGPYKIPKNTNVVIPIYVMQRNAKHWADPLKFNPDRFNSPDVEKSFTFLPFSKGTRKCVAELFAMTEMSIIVRQIVMNFKLELALNELPKDQASVTLKPESAMLVRAVRRNL